MGVYGSLAGVLSRTAFPFFSSFARALSRRFITKGWVLGLHFKGFQIRNGEFTTQGGGSQTTKRNMGALPNASDKEPLSDECCLPCSETFPQHWLW